MLRLIARNSAPVVGDKTLYVRRMCGPIITVKYHQEDTTNDVCELIRKQLPEFSNPSYHYYRWNPTYVKLIKLVTEDGDSYTGPFLLENQISDYVDDGDTIYMVYDMPME